MNMPGVVFVLLLGVYVVYAAVAGRRKRTADAPRASGITFVMLLPPFVMLCCSGLKRPDRRAVFSAFWQSVLFALACYFGYRQGVFSRHLISPLHIGAGIAAGHLIFGISLVVTHRSVSDTWEHFVDFGGLWRFAIDSPTVLLQFISVGIAEELIYRVGAQPLLMELTGSAVWGILMVAVGFACVHEHFFKNERLQSGEFLAFAILLGVVYYWTASLILVIVIHAVRNIEIAFIEHLIRVEECGGEGLADREAEFLRGERLLVLLVVAVRRIETACFEYTAGWGPEARLVPVTPITGNEAS